MSSSAASLSCFFFFFFFFCQARVSHTNPDHGGSQRGGSECRWRVAEGQRSQGSTARVHWRRGEEHSFLYMYIYIFVLNILPQGMWYEAIKCDWVVLALTQEEIRDFFYSLSIFTDLKICHCFFNHKLRNSQVWSWFQVFNLYSWKMQMQYLFKSRTPLSWYSWCDIIAILNVLLYAEYHINIYCDLFPFFPNLVSISFFYFVKFSHFCHVIAAK